MEEIKIEDVKEEVPLYTVINNHTGEVVRQFTPKQKKEDKLKEQFNKVKEHKVPTEKDLVFPWKSSMFVKLYCSEELPEYSSDSFLIYWIKLSKKLSQSTNIIVNKGKTSQQDSPMTKEDIIKELNISGRTFTRFIKESMDKNIIVKDTIEGDCIRIQYVMNPLYTFNGKNINYYTFELFKHDKKFTEKLNQTMLDSYDYLKTQLKST